MATQNPWPRAAAGTYGASPPQCSSSPHKPVLRRPPAQTWSASCTTTATPSRPASISFSRPARRSTSRTISWATTRFRWRFAACGMPRGAALPVRLIVDGHSNNNQMPRALEAHLIREGVAIREFHPKTSGERMWAKHRSHDKLLLVDCEQMITGGRNLKNEYFGLDCRNYVDRNVYLRGCKAAERDAIS